MFTLNRKERMNICVTKSIKNICGLPLIWYDRSIMYNVRRYRTERLRQSKLLLPTKCLLDVFLYMEVRLSAGG